MTRWTRRLSILSPAVVAVLAACAAPPADPNGPLAIAERRLAYVPGLSPIYCYRTLGDPDCFSTPQPGPPNRLINGYDDLTDG
ncbi:MAG: hypothetical protein ACTS3R_07715 [Inquilinaceae bacterium]